MSEGYVPDLEPRRPVTAPAGSNNTLWIVLGTVAAVMVGYAGVIVVCLAAISMIGTSSQSTFSKVGSSLSNVTNSGR